MEEILTPLKTTIISPQDRVSEQLVLAEPESLQQAKHPSLRHPHSLEEALEILRSKPDINKLSDALQWLTSHDVSSGKLNTHGERPQVSRIARTLVDDILPDYWSLASQTRLAGNYTLKDAFQICLSSITGLSVITARLGTILMAQDAIQEQSHVKESEQARLLQELLELLDGIFIPEDFMFSIWQDPINLSLDVVQKSVTWRELVNLLANGKIISLAAQADRFISKRSMDISEGHWLGDGAQYSCWSGRRLEYMLCSLNEDKVDGWKECSQMFERCLSLGYADILVEETYSHLVCGHSEELRRYERFFQNLNKLSKRTTVFSLLRILSKSVSSEKSLLQEENRGSTASTLGATAALLASLGQNSRDFEDLLAEWISRDGLSYDLGIQRAVIRALSQRDHLVKSVFETALSNFGDKLQIKHTPTTQQEGTANTRILLIVAGYVNHADSEYLGTVARSSKYLNAISNRLAASSARASVLGMYVGTAISELVDPPEKRMNFSFEDIDSPDGKMYLNLTRIQDPIGSISDLKSKRRVQQDTLKKDRYGQNIKESYFNSSQISTTSSKVIAIEEVEHESEEDEDLPMYEKPDSDTPDEDEDPTLVERNKPTAPVYIRDLVSGLRETENFDRHKIALSTASTLIRRKAAFGTEVSDHIEDIVSILTGLSDRWEMENFQEWRLQAMIAVLIAQPSQMGPWFSRHYFGGEFSVSQRISILTTLGIGARELAGHGKEDAALTGTGALPANPFPSKKLPDKLHKMYALDDADPVKTLSARMEKTMIQPMALQAADTLSGPNALKVRTFSSRMEVEKKRSRPIPNALAKIVADGFFFPLTGGWQMHIQAL
ncbi:MAG: hypothetical protein Q9214_005759 [Letrouitia sp. 1 TL-2023]